MTNQDPQMKKRIIKSYRTIITMRQKLNTSNDNNVGFKFEISEHFYQTYPEIAKALEERLNFELDEFKNFIYRKINLLGISQNELAERSLMPKQTLSNKMQMKSPITLNQALALSFGMELSRKEFQTFLSLLGYRDMFSFNPVVVVVELCIERGINDITYVNEILEELKLPLLGSKV